MIVGYVDGPQFCFFPGSVVAGPAECGFSTVRPCCSGAVRGKICRAAVGLFCLFTILQFVGMIVENAVTVIRVGGGAKAASPCGDRRSRHWVREGLVGGLPPPACRPAWLFRLPVLMIHSSFRYSRMSPGWQSSSRQMASSVEKRMALAFPVFRMERLAGVRSMRSASVPRGIFRLAIITSRFTIMGMCVFLMNQMVSSCSSCIRMPISKI